MKLSTALTLGRISNLPTIWTNVVCTLSLTQTPFTWETILLAGFSISLFYLAGMYLNDLFDVQWDNEHSNPRPLVTGLASIREVLTFSIIFIVGAFAFILIGAAQHTRVLTLISAVLLLLFILLYDWKHKQWTLSPWLMGACRFCVYLTAAAFISKWTMLIIVAGAALLLYIAGITYLARAEQQNKVTSYIPAALLFCPSLLAIALGYNSWLAWLFVVANIIWLTRAIIGTLPDNGISIPKIIGSLLAGICLTDAMLLAAINQIPLAIGCVLAFGLCIFLQKYIAAS